MDNKNVQKRSITELRLEIQFKIWLELRQEEGSVPRWKNFLINMQNILNEEWINKECKIVELSDDAPQTLFIIWSQKNSYTIDNLIKILDESGFQTLKSEVETSVSEQRITSVSQNNIRSQEDNSGYDVTILHSFKPDSIKKKLLRPPIWERSTPVEKNEEITISIQQNARIMNPDDVYHIISLSIDATNRAVLGMKTIFAAVLPIFEDISIEMVPLSDNIHILDRYDIVEGTGMYLLAVHGNDFSFKMNQKCIVQIYEHSNFTSRNVIHIQY